MMAASQPTQGHQQEMWQTLYSSLLLLGLDAASLEHDLHTPVQPTMFVRMNKKLGEFILHFLFTCIDREKAAKIFRDCWPLYDKKQESQFHKATFEWYKNLQQSYGQSMPTVVAKTFMVPGGARFTSTLFTLTRIAFHSSATKRRPDSVILHYPTRTRHPARNQETLTLIQASKDFHYREYLAKQKCRQDILRKLQDKAKELVKRYRSVCTESDSAAQTLQSCLRNNDRIGPLQKETFISGPLSAVQEGILEEMSKMNDKAKTIWNRVHTFKETEEKSWKIIAPLMDGTASLSRIDGSLYYPQVPQVVYSDCAATVSKMDLKGLYTDDKLDLLSLVQYSNLALGCLLQAVRTARPHARPESTEELNVQAGRISSLNETVNELTSRLNALLPTLMESVSTLRQQFVATLPSTDTIDLDDNPNLCPPTPPLSLVNTPVNKKKGFNSIPLKLTPGMQNSFEVKKFGGNVSGTPSKLIFPVSMTQAAKRSPKGNVLFSPTTHKDKSVSIMAEERKGQSEAETGLPMEMLTVDCRGRYQKQREDQTKSAAHIHHDLQPHSKKSSVPKNSSIPRGSSFKSSVPVRKKVLKNTAFKKATEETCPKEKTIVSTESERVVSIDQREESEKDPEKDEEDLLLSRLTDVIVGEDDQSADTVDIPSPSQSDLTPDSGCMEMNYESDSETLLDAISKMDITVQNELEASENEISLQDTTVCAKTIGTPVGLVHTESLISSSLGQGLSNTSAQLIDLSLCESATCTNRTPVGTPGKDSFMTSTNSQSVNEGKRDASESTSQIPLDKMMNQNTRQTPTSLKQRLSLLIQSPKRKNTPLAFKILAKFEGLESRARMNTTTNLSNIDLRDTSRSAAVEELKHHSKTNLINASEQLKQIRLLYNLDGDSSENRRRTEASETKSKFLSYAENLKREKYPSSEIQEAQNDREEVKRVVESSDNIGDMLTATGNVKFGDETSKSIREDYLDTLSKMQSLLDDGDETLTESNCEGMISNGTLEEAEEMFIDSREAEKTFLRSPETKSSYLPRNSVFSTLTDSIVTGESSSSLLTDQEVRAEIRRESVSSRRQSLASVGRMSIGSSKRMSDMFTVFQERLSVDCPNIFDESDSCLLSTSMDDL